MKIRSRIAALAVVALVAAAAAVACSNQGEGERCDSAGPMASDGRPNAGSDDCQSPLICWPKSQLGSNADLCCPADRRQSTTAACAQSQSPVGDAGIPDSGPVPPPADAGGDGTTTDSGPVQEAGADTGADAAADTGADAAPPADAGSDAPSDAAEGG